MAKVINRVHGIVNFLQLVLKKKKRHIIVQFHKEHEEEYPILL